MKFQDLKSTPQKITSIYKKNNTFEESFTKELLCPFIQTLTVARTYHSQTPIKQQPEYLLSPSPVKKDLFSLLLGTQIKQLSSVDLNQDLTKDDDICMSEYSEQQNESIQQQNSFENEVNWSQQNGIRKRKRKSTAQIRYLKQELQGEINWTKQKILKMSQITGLSQSQVYKWCWDQKKKQNKIIQQQSKCFNDKHKFIKKNYYIKEQIYKKINKFQNKQEHIYQHIFNKDLLQKSKKNKF